MSNLSEESIEQMALDELQTLGWQVAFGPYIAFDGPHPEQEAAANHSDVVLKSFSWWQITTVSANNLSIISNNYE